jgi:fatty-acyl-CoA synthase
MGDGTTLVSAMSALRRGPGRGFRFVGLDRQERYFPYEDMEAEAHRRAAFLLDRGLKKGDRVALVIPEPHEFVLTFLGCSVAGLVPVPIYPRASFKNAGGYVDILAHIIGTAEAAGVFCMERNRDVVSQIGSRGVDVPIWNAEDAFVGSAPSGGLPKVSEDDLCFLQFTSGSTSKPKGVMVTHGNLVANARAFLGPKGLDRNDDDVGVSWLPLFHDMGLIGFALGTLVCDIPVVLLPTETFGRSPRVWLEKISEHRGTITYAPNFAYGLVTKRIKDRDLEKMDLSQLRVAGCGAEPIRARTLLDFAERMKPAGFSPKAFLPSYGMAEATLAITFHQLGDEMKVDHVDADAMKDGVARPADESTETTLEVVSCGESFPEHEVKVVDPDGKELGERRVGQVVTRGPSVTKGYFQNPAATAESWKDGWLQTGDLGYWAKDDQGRMNLHICGRIKDLIIIRGANHYPQDIEWAVADIEGVRRGNVIAFSTMIDGTEELVVAAEATSRDAERLRKDIAREVQRGFGLSPKHVAVVPVGTLPKTSSGKAQRRKTRTLYEAGDLPEHPSSD